MKDFVPPIIISFLKRKSKYGFFGDYKSWAEALADSKGYDSPVILEKVLASTLKVKNGQAVYERDSVTFDRKEYFWPVLASLLWIASKNYNRLNVLDFGGSLGSSYFQNIDFLKHLKELRWNVVEQKNFVEAGRKDLEDEHLKFYPSVKECLTASKPQVLLASSVLQYLEKPYEALKDWIDAGFEYIVFDRTAFLPDHDRLTVQKVRPGIYDASYPAWFINKKKFLEMMGRKYRLLAEFDSLGGDKGFLYVSITSQKT